ncbi:MAG: ABC transporter substrate-binding protein [Anaerolineae bacterium]|nr:ABC transporter substrate-binding protein [Anaerolineae bacterium]MDQ7033899.1 ABC transporter substrate-binding protein [Anaerolineae bacterium]
MRKLVLLTSLMLLIVSLGVVSAQEDTLTVLCTPQIEWCEAMRDAFQAETGIETSFVRMSSGESLARIRATADDPEFSVWWGGPADAFIAASGEGLLEPYESPNAAMIADDQRDSEDFFWTGVYVGALGFCSNIEILDELGVDPPTSWDDLLNPALEANVAVAHPATSGTSFTAFWTVVTLRADELEAEEEGTGYDEDGAPTEAAVDNAFDYFAELNNNILQYTRSGSAPGRMAGAGEVAVAIIFSHDCVALQVQGFEDILTVSFAEEGTGFEIAGMGIIKDGPEPENARAWYDWALTADAQALGVGANAFQIPTNPDTPLPELAVNLDDVNLVDYNFDAAGANRTAIAERFDEDIATTPTE